MKTKTLHISRCFHTDWKQLSPEAMHMLATARQMLGGEKLTVATAQAVCKKPFAYLLLKPEQLYDIINDLAFLKTPCTVFTMPSIKHNKVTYYAPLDMLANFRMIELVKSDHYLDLFQRTGKEEYLDRLIAVLYRPAALVPDEYDIREKYNSQSLEARAKELSSLSPERKQVILFNYVECWKEIQNRNRSLFPKSDDDSGNSEGISRGQLWVNILFDLGETTYFAGEQAAKQAFIHDALSYLNKKAKERTKQ